MIVSISAYYYIVCAVIVLTLSILFYLLCINIVSRRSLKSCLIPFAYAPIGKCLWCLLLLHVTSFTTIASLLWKHIGASSNRQSCDAVNVVTVVSFMFSRFFIGMVWESQHRAMTEVLNKVSAVGRWILAFTKLLVLAPLVILGLVLKNLKTEWNGDNQDCIAQTPINIGHIELYTILSVSWAFFVLFLLQVWQAFHMNSFWSETTTTDRESQVARRATLRNVFVTVAALFWLVIYEWPLNVSESPGSEGFTSYVYAARLVIALDELTNNIVLYFVFRNWSFFLCYPCNSQALIPFLNDSFTDDGRGVYLLDDTEESSNRTHDGVLRREQPRHLRIEVARRSV